MKRIDFRIILGLLLVLAGGLLLVDKILQVNISGLFWAVVFAVGAVIFLIWFFRDGLRWWAAIPGFALAGMAVGAVLNTILPGSIDWGGLAFLGGIGIGFWAVYIRRPDQWWAIIPGGVLLTLAISDSLGSVFKVFDSNGSVFFVGLGLTFLLVGLLAKMRWAYIPAGVLLLLGFILGMSLGGVLAYAWIAIVMVAGIFLVISAIRAK